MGNTTMSIYPTLFCLLLYWLSSNALTSESSCPDNWLPFRDTCYLVREMYNISLNKARGFCSNSGGRLMQWHTPEDREVMSAMINHYNWTEKFWVGLDEKFLTYYHMGSMFWIRGPVLMRSCQHEVFIDGNYSVVNGLHCYAGLNTISGEIQDKTVSRSYGVSSTEECEMLCNKHPVKWECFTFYKDEVNKDSSTSCESKTLDNVQDLYVQLGSVTCVKYTSGYPKTNVFYYVDNCNKNRSVICENVQSTTATMPQSTVSQTTENPNWEDYDEVDISNVTWDKYECPEGFFQINTQNRKCYKVVTLQKPNDGLTFSQAKAKCRSQPGFKPDLASIGSIYENAAVTSRFPEYSWGMWIGLFFEVVYYSKYTFTEAVSKWSDDSTPGFQNWAGWSRKSRYGCTEILTSPGTPGTWNSLSCRSKRGYVCQTFKELKNPLTTTTGTSTSYCKNGWTAYRNACYKVFSNSQQFQSAEAICRAHNSYLVSVHSEAENAFVLALSEMDLPIWIGMKSKEHNKTTYEWIDGWAITYTKWSSGKLKRTKESCVKMLSDGHWLDFNCNIQSNFVCKHTSNEKLVFPPNSHEDCPNSRWTKWGNKCYYFWVDSNNKTSTYHRSQPYKFTWLESQSRCKILAGKGYDGNLVVIESYVENWMILNKLKNIIHKFDSSTKIWTGLQRNGINADFETVKGSKMNYTYWAPGEPNSPQVQQQCVEMLLHDWAGAWNDEICDRKNYFVCEAQARTISHNTKPDIVAKQSKCPSDSWVKIGNFCYLFKSNSLVNWNTASEMCRLYGNNRATLVSIHSSEERVSLINHLMFAQKDITGSNLWIGLFKNGPFKENPYMWQDNSSVVYQFWRNNEPNDRNGKDNCVDMYSVTGEWRDISCQENRGFICKAIIEAANVKISTYDDISKHSNEVVISGMLYHVLIICLSAVFLLGLIIVSVVFCCWRTGRKKRHKFQDYIGLGLIVSSLRPVKR